MPTAMASSGSNAARVRNKYTPRACNECQRRKRRCSGEKQCRNCRHWGTECVFSELRGSRHWRTSALLAPDVAATDWATTGNQTNPQATLSTAPSNNKGPEERDANVQRLEEDGINSRLEPERLATTPQGDQQTLAQILSPTAPCSGDNHGHTPFSIIDTEPLSPPESVFERNTIFMTGTAFFQQIDLLDRLVTRAQGTDAAKVGVVTNSTSAQDNIVADIYRDIDQTVEQARAKDATKIHKALNIFFTNVHPHYPCMNETHLWAQYSAFIANDSNCLTKYGSVQLAALLDFIMAVASILSDTSTQDECLPGWKEFCRGERLLSHAMWLEKANIVTVQTLLVKTLYFTYATLLNSAYDTIGTAVRLCFQLGLHNEPSWGIDCKFYDRTYRQRVFWSVFCLNHNVAQTRGVPELLRESDLNVGLPKCVDDRMLYPDCLTLPETPATSTVPYLLQTITLTRLSSEVWEAMFGARAKKPVDQEFVIAMDNKIIEFSQEIPPFLRWPANSRSQKVYEGAPFFLQQQGLVLHLRILYLRMLLQRDEMISLTYGKKAAQLCIEVASEVVAAVEAAYTSQRSNHCARHAYLHHLTGAIVPMICIIVRQNNGEDVIQPAINLLNKSLKIIESFSQRSFLAGRILHQLQRPIKAAQDAIELRRPQNTRSGAAADAIPSSGIATNPLTSFIGPTQHAAGRSGNVNSEWDLPLPSVYQDPFQDPLQKPPDVSYLLEDTGIDLWNNLNWSA